MHESPDLRAQKNRLRHAMRARRRSQSPKLVAEHSANIRSQIEELTDFKEATTVCLYIPFDKEVDTLPLIERSLGRKRVISTRVLKDFELELREISRMEDFEIGAYGIKVPKQSCPLVEPSAVDLFVVPGLAFDRDNHRLGFGAGYYDRLLASLSAMRIGLAYRFQIVDTLPRAEHDIAMDRVVTETS